VPETGRQAVILVSPNEEIAMGAEAFAEFRKKEKTSGDPIQNERVSRIGQRIAAAVGEALPGAKWEFVVFESKEANAFALPGGKVGVYTGLLKLAETDDELAIVMGHEIAHVTARHGAERMTQAFGTALGAAVVQVATDRSSKRDEWQLAYGLGATLGTLAFSRSHESEADYIGLKYAAKAGYDPRASVSFWKKMAAESKGVRPPKWLSTHPPQEERIARLQGWIPAMLPVYEKARERHVEPGL
jgi:predicted Zn-dependent protease